MSEHSAISWTDSTWNCLAGCTRVSEGCDNCYAAALSAGRLKNTRNYRGLAVITHSGRAAFNGIVRYIPDRLVEPLRWRSPRKIFVNSMSDLFHHNVPDLVIDRVFAVMALAPRHTFQVLTKRPERMREYCVALTPERLVDAANRDAEGKLPIDGGGANNLWHVAREARHRFTLPLPNVWLGVSIENEDAMHRVSPLRATPAAVRIISFEPLLGPINVDGLRDIDWAIIGGESGPGYRSMDPGWAEALAKDCRVAGIAVWVKQDSGPRPGMRGRLSDALWSLKQFPGPQEAAHA